MDKKTIDNIVWWIPFRKLRNSVRDLLRLLLNKNNLDTIEHDISNFNERIMQLKTSIEYNNELQAYNQKIVHFSKNHRILSVELETQNRCNGGCSFCPVSVGNDVREYKEMSFELFNKIIDDLVEIEYTDRISLYSNNEPFIDKRIPEFLKIAKEKLPNACHFIYTNGSVLTLELFIEAMKYLDIMIIDNYNDEGVLNPPIKIISDFIEENTEYAHKVKISMRKKNEILTSRAGNAPNKGNSFYNKRINELCWLPFLQFIIRPDGKVSLCCNDAYGQITLGDLNKQSVQEIWDSDNYRDIRMLSLMGRENIFLCKNCDEKNSIYKAIGYILINDSKTAAQNIYLTKN